MVTTSGIMGQRHVSGEMLACLRRYWGYSGFRPWQEDSVFYILDDQDSLTVLPTGGGKSLCYQLPAMLKEGMAVVISPLISLMKDQVDTLKDMGIPAEFLNSSQLAPQQRTVIEHIRDGKVKLLYLSPERLQSHSTLSMLKESHVSFFVIDEAHCISHWGHDFREEYRTLGMIRENFKGIGVHAFTATATQEVQRDIIKQLRFSRPRVNIASVDRANLTYRVVPRGNVISQVTAVLHKHEREAGIIYCLRRDDVDKLSGKLNSLGFKNLPYHAGLSDQERHDHQERFMREKVDIIVATVAFGMGIDRSNIRFVVHAAMPKSIEHYHQETGRAGRDGLPSACYMFYSGADFRTWSFFMEQSGNKEVMAEKLSRMYNFCVQPQCRHKVFVEYFGQAYEGSSCGACDYCLSEVETVDDPGKVSRVILEAVEKINGGGAFGFGAGHITNVLKGAISDQVAKWRHEHVPFFGAMQAESVSFIRYMIDQLAGQGFLVREGEFLTLLVTDAGKQVLEGAVVPVLAKPLVAHKKREIAQRQKTKRESEWSGVDRELFEALRRKRAELAEKQGVPAYIIFGDRSLKDMAAKKPSTREEFADIFGVGEHKLKLYAKEFLRVIAQGQ